MLRPRYWTPFATVDPRCNPTTCHASFITGCGAPDDMKVTVRVAVKMGRAVGVTVTTNPPSAGVAACVDRSVRGLQWPVSPKADFVTTSY